MKKILLLILVVFVGWNYLTRSPNSSAAHLSESYEVTELSRPAPVYRHQSNFRCDGRQYCSQMNSRAEAEFFIRNCPNTKMDGDRDGIPCENDSRF